MGEIKIVSFGFAPKGWAQANGQFLPINQNQALFSILGTMYGGNGQTTFALPDLRSRTPIHVGGGFTEGQAGGQEQHTITLPEMAQHTHLIGAQSGVGGPTTPAGNVLSKAPANVYGPPNALVPMNAVSAGVAGGGQPHENRQPYLVLNMVIALVGIFPSRN